MIIKLILAGFPCTQFSIAQKGNRINKVDFTAEEFIQWHNATPNWWLHISEFEKQIGEKLGVEGYRFADGLQLFFNCLVTVDRVKAATDEKVYYLFENVSSMQKQIKEVMAEILNRLYGGQMTEINSALVSAQNRKRIYFTNYGCEIQQPEDRGILLKDVLDNAVAWQEKSYALTTRCNGAIPEDTLKRNRHTMVAEPVCLRYERTDYAKSIRKGYEAGEIDERMCNLRNLQPRPDGKTNTLTTVQKDNMIAEPVRVGCYPSPDGTLKNSQGMRLYSIEGKSVNITTNGGGIGGKTGLYAIPIEFVDDVPVKAVSCADGKEYPVYQVLNGQITIKDKQYPIKLQDGYYIIRKLTVTECRRLQTIPDWYIMPCSNSQNYKMLGNGWTCEVIKWIMQHIPNIENETIDVISLYDGMSCGMIALKELGCNVTMYVAYEIDKYAIQTTMANFPEIVQLGDAFKVRELEWSLEKEVLE